MIGWLKKLLFNVKDHSKISTKAVFIKLRNMFYSIGSDIKLYPFPMFVIYTPKGYRMTSEDIRNVLAIIQPGDIMLRGFVGYLSDYFIPGHFNHAGLVIDRDNIVHALGEGVCKEDVLMFCRCDFVTILRPRLDQATKDLAVKRAIDSIGRPYDYDFNFENDLSLSCTELIQYAYEGHEDEVGAVITTEKFYFGLMKKQVIKPDSILYGHGLDRVFNSSYAVKKCY